MGKKQKGTDLVDSVNRVLTNKRTKSSFFLLVAFLVILGINGLLPLIEGQAHYTVEAVEMEYSEYVSEKTTRKHLRLDWVSEMNIDLFINRYIAAHPEMTPEEQAVFNVPPNFRVNVYTKFFYQYPFWYITTLISLGSTVILFYSVFNYLLTRQKEKYKKYVELEDEVNEMTQKLLDPITFEPWIDQEFNKRRKIAQHRSNVKYELQLLESSTDHKTKQRFSEYFRRYTEASNNHADFISTDGTLIGNRFEDLKIKGNVTKKERKYIDSKEKLITLLTPDYIDEYVVEGKVKNFQYIHSMFVYNGVNIVGKTVDNYSLISTDGKRIVRDAGRKVGIGVAITLLFAILVTVTAIASLKQSPFWIVINVLTKITPLFLQVFFAMNYSNNFMDTQLISNLINRRSIGLLYLAESNNEKRNEVAEIAQTN